MKKYGCLILLVLAGCARGSTWTLDSSSEESTDPTIEPITPPTTSVITPAPTAPAKAEPDPLLVLKNQGIMYSIDQTFWEAYTNTIHYGTQTVAQKIVCFNGGSMALVGSVTDDTSLNHLNLDFELVFDNCQIPDGWVTINLTYTGIVRITGYLDGGPYENNLTIRSSSLNMVGAMRLTNGQILPVNERCKINFLDNYREDQGIGGLQGKVCGMTTGVQEYDLNQ